MTRSEFIKGCVGCGLLFALVASSFGAEQPVCLALFVFVFVFAFGFVYGRMWLAHP